MLLRTASTPMLGSLNLPEGKLIRLSIHDRASRHGSHNFVSAICAADSPDDEPASGNGLRRVRSEADLLRDDFQRRLIRKTSHPRMRSFERFGSLKSVLSFSCYCKNNKMDAADENFNRPVSEETQFSDFSVGRFSFPEIREIMSDTDEDFQEYNQRVYMNIPSFGGGGGGFFGNGPRSGGGDSGGPSSLDEYYLRQIDMDPGNSLFLGNYARYLYEVKKDPCRAEKFYLRAINAQPNDGEILAQYAKFIWEYKRDEGKASDLFEKAVTNSPENCYVLAAQAHFLWSKEDENSEESLPEQDAQIRQTSSVEARQAQYLLDFTENEQEEPEFDTPFLLAEKAYALWNNVNAPTQHDTPLRSSVMHRDCRFESHQGLELRSFKNHST